MSNNQQTVLSSNNQEGVIATKVPIGIGTFVELSSASIENYSPEEQRQILELANAIDVTNKDKVTSYASVPLQSAIDDNLKFLKGMIGTEEDRSVVEYIAELSEKVNDQVNGLTIVTKKKNFLLKWLDSIRGGDERSNTINKIDSCAKLIDELKKAMEREIDIVSQRCDDADEIINSTVAAVKQMEKYLVGGYIGAEKADKEIELIISKPSIMVDEQVKAKKLDSGNKNFKLVLQNLEKSRAASGIAIMQSLGSAECLTALEVNFKSTMNNILLLFSQQSSSAMLNYTVQNAVENHKNINKLNTTLMEQNSKTISQNYEDVANMITQGFVDTAKMQECVKIIVSGAKKAQDIVSNYLDNIDSDKEKLMSVLSEVNDFLGVSTESKQLQNISKLQSGSSSIIDDKLTF